MDFWSSDHVFLGVGVLPCAILYAVPADTGAECDTHRFSGGLLWIHTAMRTDSSGDFRRYVRTLPFSGTRRLLLYDDLLARAVYDAGCVLDVCMPYPGRGWPHLRG